MIGAFAFAFGCGGGADSNAANSNAKPANSTAGDSASPAANVATPDPLADTIPSDADMQARIKTTTGLFAKAIDKGDFTELRDSASVDFRDTFSLDALKTNFKSFIDQKDKLLPILRSAEMSKAEITTPPAITNQRGYNVLAVAGEYATKPYTVHINYEYVRRDGDWKLLKLRVNIP